MENKNTRFEVLGDPTRYLILKSLSGGKSMRAKDVLAFLPISQPTLSHHMHVLESEKLVVSKKTGRECFYSINQTTVKGLLNELQNLLPEKKEKIEVSSSVLLDDPKLKKEKKEKKKKKDKKEKKEKKEKNK